MHFAIGFGLLAIIAGAVLVFAVETSASGVDLQVVGWILMLTGVVGVVVGTVAATSIGTRRREARVIER